MTVTESGVVLGFPDPVRGHRAGLETHAAKFFKTELLPPERTRAPILVLDRHGPRAGSDARGRSAGAEAGPRPDERR